MIKESLRDFLKRRVFLVLVAVVSLGVIAGEWQIFVNLREARSSVMTRHHEVASAASMRFVCGQNGCRAARPGDLGVMQSANPDDNPFLRDRLQALERAERTLRGEEAKVEGTAFLSACRLTGAGLGAAAAIVLAAVFLGGDWAMGLWPMFIIRDGRRWRILLLRSASGLIAVIALSVGAAIVGMLSAGLFAEKVGIEILRPAVTQMLLVGVSALSSNAFYFAVSAAVITLARSIPLTLVVVPGGVILGEFMARTWSDLRVVMPSQLTARLLVPPGGPNPGWPEPLLFARSGAEFIELAPVPASTAWLVLLTWSVLLTGVALVAHERRDV